MAHIKKGSIQFTGSVGNLTAYTRHGSDKVIIRVKGGADKKAIRNSPKFQRTRENNAEFADCGRAASGIRSAIYPVNHMADYNYVPVLTALAKHMQHQDSTRPRGERQVELYKHAYLLNGFQLNKQNTFDSVVRYPLHFQIDRDQAKALVQLPDLIPGLNLRLPWQHPLFRFTIALGETAGGKMYSTPVYKETNWQPVQQPFSAQEITLQLEDTSEKLPESVVLVLSVGIETGLPLSDTFIKPVKYAACAKILATG